MGTLAEGTRCYYCNAETADYIPDGGGPIGPACLDVLIRSGGQAVVRVRLRRRVAGWRCVAPDPRPSGPAADPGPPCAGFALLVATEPVAELVASYCIGGYWGQQPR